MQYGPSDCGSSNHKLSSRVNNKINDLSEIYWSTATQPTKGGRKSSSVIHWVWWIGPCHRNGNPSHLTCQLSCLRPNFLDQSKPLIFLRSQKPLHSPITVSLLINLEEKKEKKKEEDYMSHGINLFTETIATKFWLDGNGFVFLSCTNPIPLAISLPNDRPAPSWMYNLWCQTCPVIRLVWFFIHFKIKQILI